MDYQILINRLPVNTDKKLRLYNFIRRKYYKRKYKGIPDGFDSFIQSNSRYGNEYWLKQYSGFDDYIYGVIEHGIYLEDSILVGPKVDYDLGSIITFGEMRVNILKNHYPDFNIVGIGPCIHYADISESYYNELKSQLDPSSKTMAIYPAHSIRAITADFNVNSFMQDALNFAKEEGIKNILLSLHPNDIKFGLDINYTGYNVIVVSGGENLVSFLPRVKAIMKLSDIIYTNSFGTHIGFGVYMNTPIVMNINDMDKSFTQKSFIDVHETFSKTFDGSNPFTITKVQYELSDYYFGYSHIKQKQELYNELKNIKDIYQARFGI